MNAIFKSRGGTLKYLNRFWLKALLITGLLFLLCAALAGAADEAGRQLPAGTEDVRLLVDFQIGRASCRERV